MIGTVSMRRRLYNMQYSDNNQTVKYIIILCYDLKKQFLSVLSAVVHNAYICYVRVEK
jgi:hypothetical protein